MAHRYQAVVEWQRQPGETGARYSRAHRWLFDEGVEVPASASPLHVRLPYARADAVDPEEAYVAALSSCHMLFFLQFAANAGYVVESYRDAAVGEMGRDPEGREFVTSVTLAPAIAFSGEKQPDAAEIEALHHRSHESCFLANSVRTEITVAAAP